MIGSGYENPRLFLFGLAAIAAVIGIICVSRLKQRDYNMCLLFAISGLIFSAFQLVIWRGSLWRFNESSPISESFFYIWAVRIALTWSVGSCSLSGVWSIYGRWLTRNNRK